jgi:hypothetical protein
MMGHWIPAFFAAQETISIQVFPNEFTELNIRWLFISKGQA